MVNSILFCSQDVYELLPRSVISILDILVVMEGGDFSMGDVKKNRLNGKTGKMSPSEFREMVIDE